MAWYLYALLACCVHYLLYSINYTYIILSVYYSYFGNILSTSHEDNTQWSYYVTREYICLEGFLTIPYTLYMPSVSYKYYSI